MEAFTLEPPQAGSPPRSETPIRLLCLAVLWLVAAGVAGLTFDFVVGFGIGLHNAAARTGHWRPWRLDPLAYVLTSAVATQLVLLLAAWRRAWIVGQGDRTTGLGNGPLQRPRLLIGLAVLEVVCVVGWGLVLTYWLRPVDLHTFTQQVFSARAMEPAMLGLTTLVAVGLAPLCEELFFRGWLWTGLRRHWGAAQVMLATALPWLLVHMADGGVQRPLFLIPAAILFSLARHLCGGVRASIVLHVLNNLLAVGLLGALALLGHR